MKQIYKIILLSAIFSLTACGDEDSQDVTGGASSSSNSTDTTDGSNQTGILVSEDFFIGVDESPEVFDDEGSYKFSEAIISVRGNDINNLLQTEKTYTVKFVTSWGSFDKDSCNISTNGSCSVTWYSGSPTSTAGSTPPTCIVAFTAYAVGEESFINDGNALDEDFNLGETFFDLEEPYLDADDDGTFTDNGRELIDVAEYSGGAKNGIHDDADGLYNGSLCDNSTTNSDCSKTTSTIIWDAFRLPVRASNNGADNLPDTADDFNCL